MKPTTKSRNKVITRITLSAIVFCALLLLLMCSATNDPPDRSWMPRIEQTFHPGTHIYRLNRTVYTALALAQDAAEEPEQDPEFAHDDRVAWCEPLNHQVCGRSDSCPSGHACVTPWWSDGTTKVCARRMPTRDERAWRSERVRVIVDEICSVNRGCDPADLHRYIRVIALRESTWRPWKRHRLNPDLKANSKAWDRRAEHYTDNPASRDPSRWMTGLGLFGMIPAIWLDRWDPTAPPETLCGEVEAVEAHLRAGRDSIAAIAGGLDCDDDGLKDYWGSACEGERCRPSWYDVSRVNAGKLCPGSESSRAQWAKRASSVGLEPFGAVSTKSLGTEIPRETQDEVAAAIRAKMP